MPTCESFIQPLNLECLLVNTLSGTPGIFLLLGLIALGGMAAFFRMSKLITVIMVISFAILTQTLFEGVAMWLYVLMIIGLGIVIFVNVTRWIKTR